MSPSWTTYSLPSMRSLPAALIAASLPYSLEVLERVDLRADEALLEVGVDHAGGLGTHRALADRPGADLLLAGGEVRLQAEQAVALARERSPAPARSSPYDASSSPRSAGESSASSASTLPHSTTTPAPSRSARALTWSLHALPSGRSPSPTLQQYSTGLVVIRPQVRDQRRSSSVSSSRAGRLAGLEVLRTPSRRARASTLASLPPVFAAAWAFLRRLSAVSRSDEHELELDDVDVAHRIDRARHVDHVRVVEAAHHHQDRVGLADVREELVAQALALRRALDQAGDVDDLDDRGDDLLGLDVLLDAFEPAVGHRHDADVRVDRAERVVRRFGLARGEGVEDRALAHVGQADDTDRQSHGGHAYRGGPRHGKLPGCLRRARPGGRCVRASVVRSGGSPPWAASWGAWASRPAATTSRSPTRRSSRTCRRRSSARSPLCPASTTSSRSRPSSPATTTSSCTSPSRSITPIPRARRSSRRCRCSTRTRPRR